MMIVASAEGSGGMTEQTIAGGRTTPAVIVLWLLPLMAGGCAAGVPPRAPGPLPYPADLLEREKRIRALYAVAMERLNHRRPDEARSALRDIAAIDPQHPLAYLGTVLIEQRIGEPASALPRLDQIEPGESPGHLYGEGIVRFLQERLDLAEQLLGQARNGYRERGHPSGEAASLTGLGNAFLRRLKHRDARSAYEQALSIAERLEDRQSVADLLGNLGAVDQAIGDDTAALARYQSALAMREAIGDQKGVAVTLHNMGLIQRRQGHPESALRTLQRSLAIERSIADRNAIANDLRSIGLVHLDQGNVPLAAAALSEALRIAGALHDGRLEATVNEGLGLVKSRLGESRDALSMFQAALRSITSAGPDPLEADLRQDLATVLFARGDFSEALRQQERCLDIRKALGDPRGEATSLNNIGALYQVIGDRATATRYLRQALGSLHDLADGAGEALARANLGVIEEEAGDLVSALDDGRAAIAIQQAAGDRRGAALGRFNLASVLVRLGRTQEAGAELEEGLRSAVAISDLEGQALLLTGLGDLERRRGAPLVARNRYIEAIRLAASAGLREETWRAEAGLAACEDAANHPQAAYRAYERAMDAVESIRGDLGADEFKTRFFAGTLDLYEATISLLGRRGAEIPVADRAGTALAVAERARARSLLDLLSEARADLRDTLQPELARREAILLERMARARGSLQRASSPPDLTTRKETLAGVEEDMVRLQAEIRRGLPHYANIKFPQPSSSETIRRSLPRLDDRLVEYFIGEAVSCVFVVSRETMSWHTLPPRPAIEEAVRRHLALIKSPAADLGPGGEFGPQAARLGDLLLPPEAIVPGSRLLIVPDGILHYLPFETLIVSHRRGSATAPSPLLIEEHEVVYLPSATTLQLWRHSVPGLPGERSASTEDRRAGPGADGPHLPASILLVGDPTGVARRWGTVAFAPLPFAREEASRIGALFPGGSAKVLLGHAATREAIASADLSKYRYFHLAAHAWIDEEIPQRSGIALAPGGDDDDGFLPIASIFRLHLRADLAVLSACRSGLGPVVRGEGMIGLTRALLYAGARSVVVSLWDVTDRSTADLMERFYRALRNGMPVSGALRQAKLAELRSAVPSSRHPSRWAAFVLQGDPEAGAARAPTRPSQGDFRHNRVNRAGSAPTQE
jgi:CHAT domain-containing protein/tetratricopeptide (TPR) repeat protein